MTQFTRKVDGYDGDWVRADDINELQEAIETLEGGVTGGLSALDARLDIIESGVYNVLTYGAVGDGVTDDTAAIQEAIDEAGGVVWIPEGTFLVSDELLIGSNIVVMGAGYGSVIRIADGANCAAFAQSGLSNPAIQYTTIRDLRIDGNRSNQTHGNGYGITLNFARHCTVRNVWVHDTVRTGIFISGSFSQVLDCEVWNCGIEHENSIGMSGIVLDRLSGNADDPVDSQVRGNRVADVYEHGIKIYPGGDRSVVSGNSVNGCGQTGIQLTAADDLTITGNVVRDTDGMGIVVWEHETATVSNRVAITGNVVDTVNVQHGIQVDTVNDVTISGNTVAAARRAGIKVQDSAAFAVTGNTVSGCGDGDFAESGISINNSPNGTISGNTCRNNGKASDDSVSCGILLNGSTTPCDTVAVVSNRCYDDQGTKIQEYGIRVLNGADYVLLLGNVCRGNGTAATEIASAGANCVESNTVS